jgi:HSP20 family protein
VKKLSEDKKKMYYYGGKEKNAGEIRKEQDEMVPLTFGDVQRDFDRMIDRFQRDFQSFWEQTPRIHIARRRTAPPVETRMPSMDLEDKGKEYRLTVDLPGFKKEEVDVQLTEDSVAVKAMRTQTEDEQTKNYVRRERAFQTYSRRIALPEPVRPDDAIANLNNGTLEIMLPKKTPKETKKLNIT